MYRKFSLKTVIIVFYALLISACATQNYLSDNMSVGQANDAKTLGKVVFPVSCSPQAQADFENGLALLHHMMYVQAEKQFSEITEREGDCAMAWWGVAMSQLHPLWPGQPSAEALQKGVDALQKARSLKPKTTIESAYIDAATVFYNHIDSQTHAQRLATWEAAQKQLFQRYPDDIEAAVFYALSHLSIAPKGDQEFKVQKQAGELLEQKFLSHPQHPGVLHYTIHAYDNRLLAARAVTAADAYDKLAPDVPHALHMPTHIYVRLGHWDKVIDLNTRSAKAALNFPANGLISHHNPHALDYLMYAYLQQGKDQQAKQLMLDLASKTNYQKSFVSGYALAAVQARFYLEQRLWHQAAEMEINQPASFPWRKFPQTEAIGYYGRGLGAAMIGNAGKVDQALKHLDNLYQRTVAIGQQYWTLHIDVYRKTIVAWRDFEQGKETQALNLMRVAADLEDSVNKHPVTPGAILPARELLGDMLTLSGDYRQALVAYQSSLAIAPNRYSTLYGAGRAAELSGDKAQATIYYAKLEALAGGSDSRSEMLAIKQFLSRH